MHGMQEVRSSILLSSIKIRERVHRTNPNLNGTQPTKIKKKPSATKFRLKIRTAMKHYRLVLTIGIIEILIGGVTLLSNLLALALSQNTKSLSVLCFVVTAGIISTLLGIGLLKFRKIAYYLLLYFSSVIILSKVLIFMDVIHLNGALETTIPGFIKNITSVIYHGFIILYLVRPGIRRIFHR